MGLFGDDPHIDGDETQQIVPSKFGGEVAQIGSLIQQYDEYNCAKTAGCEWSVDTATALSNFVYAYRHEGGLTADDGNAYWVSLQCQNCKGAVSHTDIKQGLGFQ